MDLLQGTLLTGAAATGLVVVERVRHRGTRDEVREDVTQFGTNVAEQVGRAAGWLGHTGSRALGETAKLAERVGDGTTDVVTAAGRTAARGAGATMGAYAGAIDRVVPHTGRTGEPAAKRTSASSSTATRRSTKATTKTRGSTAKRRTAKATTS